MGETKKSTKSTAESKNTAKTKSSSSKSTNSKSTKNNSKTTAAKSKKGKKRGVWETVLIVAVVIITACWFLGGKPTLTVYDDGFYISQIEEPLINKITGKEIVPFSSDIFGVGEKLVAEENTETSASPSAASQPSPASAAPAVAKKSGGNEYSSAQADLNHEENTPLFLGNPTDSLSDTSKNTNYLMVKPQYTLSYNTETLCPNWVAWHLDADDMGPADRMNDFRPDEDLPEGWYGVKKADYQYNSYGYDRGHVCPSADRTATKEDNSMTFLMTNMVPQSPDNNRVIWMHFENYERELVKQGNEVYIIAGPYGTGGTGAKGTFDEIPITLKSGEVLHMNVPAYTWKVLIAVPEGIDDMSRITKDATAIAINVPNQMGMGKTGDWEQFICSIDDIEALTGYDFFELLPDEIEDALEAKVYSH